MSLRFSVTRMETLGTPDQKRAGDVVHRGYGRLRVWNILHCGLVGVGKYLHLSV